MKKLNTTIIYLLSIVGFLCCCLGIGWIPSLIGVLAANSELKKSRLHPDTYINVNAMKSAKAIAIFTLVISGILGLVIIYLTYMIYSSPDFACKFWSKMIESMENNPNLTQEQLDIYEKLREKACLGG